MQPRRVLRQAAIPHLREAELPLHNTERMLDFCAKAGELTVQFALLFRARPVLVVAVWREDLRPTFWRRRVERTVRLVVPRVAQNHFFIAMKQLFQLSNVSLLGRGTYYRMDQAAVAVDADMRLHPEVPLVSLLRLAHLGVA